MAFGKWTDWYPNDLALQDYKRAMIAKLDMTTTVIDRAADSVSGRAVGSLGTDDQGDDVWLVGHVNCSIRRKWCNAGPAVPDDGPQGPLCEHRLAALILEKYRQDQHKTPAVQLVERLVQAALADGANEVLLHYRLNYWRRDEEHNAMQIFATLVPTEGGKWTTVKPRVTLTGIELGRILRATDRHVRGRRTTRRGGPGGRDEVMRLVGPAHAEYGVMQPQMRAVGDLIRK